MQKKRIWGAKSPKTNRILVIVEMAITASIMCMAFMTPFFNSIGLNQQQIALSQMTCTAVAMILNIPMGWIADRFSRKWANVLGDLICATSLAIYSTVDSFAGIVACEALFGFACALSQGVDSTLLKHFSDSSIQNSDSSARMSSSLLPKRMVQSLTSDTGFLKKPADLPGIMTFRTSESNGLKSTFPSISFQKKT